MRNYFSMSKMKTLSIMKILFPFILLTSLFFAFCNDAKSQNEIPVVQSGQTYDVVVKEDIVYAEALSHDSINSANATTIPLKLDVYVPDNELENRPAYMFIHGGGFKGGSKQQSHIINLAIITHQEVGYLSPLITG